MSTPSTDERPRDDEAERATNEGAREGRRGGTVREYHAKVWDEPSIMEMGAAGRRGITFPEAESAVRDTVGSAADYLPDAVAREDDPALPEVAEPFVVRHYLHLAQETLGFTNISMWGTCTMKYAPTMNEQLEKRHLSNLHPRQDDDTLQGMLEIAHELDGYLQELSGMDRFSFQPASGTQSAFVFTSLLRKYLEDRGELDQRTEIVTTLYSHACLPATADVAGFDVVTLQPGENSYPSTEALEAAVSEKTAALMIVNPNDLGVYNPNVDEWVDIVHDAGGLCFYDQANFNSTMGISRARDVGFDASHYMLHKTFGNPKGGLGPAAGAFGCREELVEYLPTPLVEYDEADDHYSLDYDRPNSVGKVREFWGNLPLVMKAYVWVRSMGAEGIVEASNLSVLGNNYLETLLEDVPGLAKTVENVTQRRMEMTRYSWGELFEDTGVSTVDIRRRLTDFGIDAYWMSHDPWTYDEPFTPEPGEMHSKENIETYAEALRRIAEEAYDDPERVKTAPHNQSIDRVDEERIDDPDQWAMTWRAYQRKFGDHED
ncbi:aminomethyl-transferring glycine dehydrogenase subunit GcvPB [Halomarina oriensis]|uniref:Aminomethyl-transferring glycine dehydrogenase subunit GcvPB n=1 Tax=Halomarina oriensis TaxID=671145 RepID=A0A6B0GKT0_9EURY|nr:aminomethyl-transferring glycine dehydrogenase subunit GcvPB [Halomarina oriensis]MWG33403.1 aminomethyl-transferring glycine dehydrogenase subunit GcvPB [Halomarina oriensis]